MSSSRHSGPLGTKPPVRVHQASQAKAPAQGGAAPGPLSLQQARLENSAFRQFLPVDHTFQGEGSMAIALRKAILEDYYTLHANLNQGNAESTDMDPKTNKPLSSKEKLQSHISGTDLSCEITRRMLEPGTYLVQFERIGAQPGTYLTYEGVRPESLGISAKARIQHKYVVIEPLECIQSVCATLPEGTASGVGGKGGGVQLIMLPDWERFVQRIF